VRQPIERPAVRILLIDEHERVLLFRAKNPDSGLTFWFPPGGGVEPDEDVRQAITRELFEETGLTDVVIEAEIWHRDHVFTSRDDFWDQRERWFLARVKHFEPDTRGMHQNEMTDIVEWHWWAMGEIAVADERFVPLKLAELLSPVLRDGPPATPQRVGE
jgi:8-oxo-dGTP pyrophosphatase MutT (NUDIX family)